MLLLSRDYQPENMVAPEYYIDCVDSDPKKICLISKDVIVDANNRTSFRHMTFKKIHASESDNSRSIITLDNQTTEATDDILAKILAFDNNCSPENHQNFSNHVLNFCNNYGLLSSYAYTWYLGKERLPAEKLDEFNALYVGKRDYMELDDFIYKISKIRALSNAYAIYHNQNSQTSKKTNNPLSILLTLLTLLLPNGTILNSKISYEEALERLLDVDYLNDLFFGYYGGDYLATFADEKWSIRFPVKDGKKLLYTSFIRDDVIHRLHNLSSNIPIIGTEFQIDYNCSFSLKKHHYGATKAEEELYYTQTAQNLENQKNELLELLGHTSLCILNAELKNIQTYLYYDKERSSSPNMPFHIGYYCRSLYEEIILEIASLYSENIPLNKCERFDCNVLFFPHGHSDKKYCSTQCSNTVAKRTYNENKRKEKIKEQQKNKKTDNN